MKLLWIAAPALALGAFALARALVRRPLGRPLQSALIALLLLWYTLATAALGLFWVARMDLPAFDLHYLFGYCTLLCLALHVALQLRPLAVTLRRASPRWLLSADGSRFLPGVRIASGAVIVALLAVPAVAYVLGCISSRRAAVIVTDEPPASNSADPTRTEVWIMREGTKTLVVDWLYDESRLTRASTLSPVVVVTEPDEVKSPSGEGRALPKPASKSGRALGRALSPETAAGLASPHTEGAIVVERSNSTPPDLPTIATLLHYAAGVTNRKAQRGGLLLRAAASAGALYPVDVYAISDSLGAGAHYYHPHEHALFRTATSDEAVRHALPADSAARRAPLVFVLAATFDRTAFKYAKRAYRYVALDTGHVAQNLLLAARALGLRCVLEPHFDDAALLSAIGGNAKNEGAMLVVGCSAEDLPESRSARQPPHEPVELPESTAGLETTRLSHRLTAWRLLPGASTARPTRTAAVRSKQHVALPGGEAATRDVLEAISERRSVREMARRKLALSTLGEVLREAWTGATSLYTADLIELVVLAIRMDGLAEGSYRYDGELHALVRVGDLTPEPRRAALDQEVLSLAAAVLVWGYASDLGSRSGARDFRVGALQAGLGGEAAYLAATARGLGVCGVGAFYDDEVALLSGGAAARPLYLVALGPR